MKSQRIDQNAMARYMSIADTYLQDFMTRPSRSQELNLPHFPNSFERKSGLGKLRKVVLCQTESTSVQFDFNWPKRFSDLGALKLLNSLKLVSLKVWRTSSKLQRVHAVQMTLSNGQTSPLFG